MKLGVSNYLLNENIMRIKAIYINYNYKFI